MKRIEIGHAGSKPVHIDLDVLLRTRGLAQANSGGGKSWLARRLAEQSFGKLPVIITDPEGEFATLRERFGFVLVGKGGETPADPRSAQIVAHKLLELGASAVCDLYDLKPHDRHRWMKLFLEALVDAPKSFWRPLLLLIDEAHVFCPEKGQGESEASSAVQDVVTRGRKRGICPFLFTQRLAKLSKNVSAECLNRLVGMTFEDVDLERAADLLSVPRSEREAFFREMKTIEPGHFYGLGRAIAKDRVLVKIGPVLTTHPEMGTPGYASKPPPAPEKIRALLPKLQDLPKEAAEKAKTEADLRAEIRSLKAQVAARPKEAVLKPKVERVEVPMLRSGEILRLERAMAVCDRAAGSIAASLGAIRGFSDIIGRNAKIVEQRLRRSEPVRTPVHAVRVAPVAAVRAGRSTGTPENGDVVDKAQRAILNVLAQWPDGCDARKLALLAGYRWSGGFRNGLSALRSRGYVHGGNKETMRITNAGAEAVAGRVDPLPTGSALAEYWLAHPSFGQAERKALTVMLEHPDGLTGPELADAAGYGWSGGFRNALSSLRTAGVLVGRNTERMRPCDELLEAVS